MRARPHREVSPLVHWLFVILTMTLFFFSLRVAAWVILPLVASFILCYLLLPMTDYLEHWGLSRLWSVLLVVTVLVIGILLLIPTLIGIIAEVQINSTIKNYMSKLGDIVGIIITNIEQRMPGVNLRGVDDLFADNGPVSRFFDHDLPKVMIHGLLEVAKLFPFFLLIPYMAFYFLLDGRVFKKQLIAGIPNRYFEQTLKLIHRVDSQIAGFLRGLFLESIIIGTLASVGLYIMGVENYILLGVLTGVLNIIPYVGPAAAAVVACLASLTNINTQSLLFVVTEMPAHYLPVCVLVWYVVVRAIDDVLVIPLVMGHSLSMHPLVIMFTLFAGGEIAGFLGLLFALPVVGVVHVFLQQLLPMCVNPRARTAPLAEVMLWESEPRT
ncbi:MAG: AI-2E family transporter [Verrucomicrobiae bacterium]|nr:AI-2E family transporter [Verrucomicrobiae bacterium]